MPPGDMKAFCMSTTTSAVRARVDGDGLGTGLERRRPVVHVCIHKLLASDHGRGTTGSTRR